MPGRQRSTNSLHVTTHKAEIIFVLNRQLFCDITSNLATDSYNNMTSSFNGWLVSRKPCTGIHMVVKYAKMKKRSEETQTLRACCSKAEPNVFAPPQTPFPGAREGQNLISWRQSLPLPTNTVW